MLVSDVSGKRGTCILTLDLESLIQLRDAIPIHQAMYWTLDRVVTRLSDAIRDAKRAEKQS